MEYTSDGIVLKRFRMYPEVDSSEDVIIGRVFDKSGGKPTWLAR